MAGPCIPDTLATARAYAARGWSVIPFEPQGKRPALAWLEFQKRCATVEEIDRWFRHRRDANVGIVMGVVSDVVVLDIDSGHGGADSLRELENERGPLPVTVEAITGGGGRHLYFAHPGGTVPNRVGLAPGIDVRGDGGCVVAPPSLHASGRRYTWARGRAPGEAPIAPMPHWLLAYVRPERAHPGHSPAHWRELVRSNIEQGMRNNALASLAGHLLWHGIDPEVALELLLGWNRMRCRPPLADDEVAAVVESITHLHGRRQPT